MSFIIFLTDRIVLNILVFLFQNCQVQTIISTEIASNLL